MQVDENVSLEWDNMLAGIHAQVELLTRAPRELYAQVSDALPPDRVPGFIYAAGCGDSYYAAIATRLALMRWTGLMVEPLESLEFSRYLVDFAPPDAMVIAISNSGKVARTVEAAMAARERGLMTVGLSYNRQGRLGQVVAAPVFYAYPEVGFGPGTLSYLGTLLGLYAIGLRVARLRGRLTDAQVDHELARLEAQADVVRATIERARAALVSLAEATPRERPVFLVGGGPSYGSALFGMAKLIEAARQNAVAQELEEWAHEQYFCTGPGTLTFMWAPPGRSLGRAREQLAAVRDVGGQSVAFVAEGDRETASLADFTVAIPGVDDETLTPISYVVPIEVYAHAFASSKGLTMLGFDDPNRMSVNFRQIFGSRVETRP